MMILIKVIMAIVFIKFFFSIICIFIIKLSFNVFLIRYKRNIIEKFIFEIYLLKMFF